MKNRKKTVYVAFINTLLFSALILFHFSGASLKIGNANPIAVLALLVAVIMFSGELAGIFTGLAIGVVLDSVTSTPVGFNTVTLVLISFFATFIAHYLFNRNIKSAIVLCLICAALYFSARWLAGFAFRGDVKASFNYLFGYAATSAVYTTVFIIPFFYLEKRLFSKITI